MASKVMDILALAALIVGVAILATAAIGWVAGWLAVEWYLGRAG